mgnify:CR=1 FL=1
MCSLAFIRCCVGALCVRTPTVEDSDSDPEDGAEDMLPRFTWASPTVYFTPSTTSGLPRRNVPLRRSSGRGSSDAKLPPADGGALSDRFVCPVRCIWCPLTWQSMHAVSVCVDGKISCVRGEGDRSDGGMHSLMNLVLVWVVLSFSLRFSSMVVAVYVRVCTPHRRESSLQGASTRGPRRVNPPSAGVHDKEGHSGSGSGTHYPESADRQGVNQPHHHSPSSMSSSSMSYFDVAAPFSTRTDYIIDDSLKVWAMLSMLSRKCMGGGVGGEVTEKDWV